MALEKEGYRSAIRGTTKVKVETDENGNIVISDSVTAKGNKYLSINQVNAANNYADNNDVIGVFVSIVGGQYDPYSNKMTVTWGLT